MRKLEFKVFDKVSGEMSPSFSLFGEFTMMGAVFAWLDHVRGNVDGVCGIIDLNDLKVLQYTGLKDVNGAELYEGDIYKHWGCIEQAEFDQVIYDNMQCTLLDGDFEIIGNIYENPELLEGDS